jgi:chemotaxis protein CheX
MEPSNSLPFSISDIDTMVSDSVEKVFSTMMSASAKLYVAYNNGDTPEKTHPRLKAEPESMMVMAVIGFLGEIRGVIYLYMDEPTSARVTMNFLGLTKDELSNDTVNDALGELSNMISGTYKNQLCDKGFNCRLTIPSILRGNFTVEPVPGATHRLYQYEVGDAVVGLELVMAEGE